MRCSADSQPKLAEPSTVRCFVNSSTSQASQTLRVNKTYACYRTVCKNVWLDNAADALVVISAPRLSLQNESNRLVRDLKGDANKYCKYYWTNFIRREKQTTVFLMLIGTELMELSYFEDGVVAQLVER